MTLLAPCLLALCQAAAGSAAPLDARPAPQIACAKVNEQEAAAVLPAPAPIATAPTNRALQPLEQTSAMADGGVRIGKLHAFEGGKLLLTNGISTVEGASGGGIARWATIAGSQTPGGIGVSGHVTAIELPDFGWRSYGAALGFGDRLELSFARADFDTRDAGALLGWETATPLTRSSSAPS